MPDTVKITLGAPVPTEPGRYFHEDDFVKVVSDGTGGLSVQHIPGGDRIPIRFFAPLLWSRRIEVVQLDPKAKGQQ